MSSGAISANDFIRLHPTSSDFIGRVAIGTTAPSARVEINGDVKVTGSVLGEDSWTYPTANFGWITTGSGYMPLRFVRDKLGYVHVQGSLKGGSQCGVLFTLPVGYRPANILHFPPVLSGGTAGGFIKVFQNGDVGIYNCTLDFIGLDTIYFELGPTCSPLRSVPFGRFLNSHAHNFA